MCACIFLYYLESEVEERNVSNESAVTEPTINTTNVIDNPSATVDNPSTSTEPINEETTFGSDFLFSNREENTDSHGTIVPDDAYLEDTWDSGILANLSDDCNTTEVEFIDDQGNKRTAAIIQVIPEPEFNTNSNDSHLIPEEALMQNSGL